MDDKTRSNGESLRESAKVESYDDGGRVEGHGLEGERPDVTRRLRTGVESGSADPELMPTGTGVPGNTSETGEGTPGVSGDNTSKTTRPRSPLGPGCGRTTGTMFIATISLLAIASRLLRR